METDKVLTSFLETILTEKMYFHVTVDDASKNRYIVRKVLTESEFQLGDEIFKKYFSPATPIQRTKHAFFDPTLTYEEITVPDTTGFAPASSSHPLKRRRYGEKNEAPLNEQKAVSNLVHHYQTILYGHLY